jgi:hypothetical protein
MAQKNNIDMAKYLEGEVQIKKMITEKFEDFEAYLMPINIRGWGKN